MKRAIPCLIPLLFILHFPCSFAGVACAEQELIVSAAASLTNAFTEVAQKFEAVNSKMKITLNFAASGALLQQIDKGAPVDVFASADQKTMDQAGEKNLILPETRRDFVKNELVCIVPAGSKLRIEDIKDLTAADVGKIALGNPETVPGGRYAREVLTNEGLWEQLQPKYIMGESVRQALDYVVRGEVDAGFVFATDATVAKDRVKVVLEARKHKPITYPIAVVRSTKNRDLGQRFIDFVMSAEGQKILSGFGFKTP
jgi:molybdate transport system substrate-binding protein